MAARPVIMLAFFETDLRWLNNMYGASESRINTQRMRKWLSRCAVMVVGALIGLGVASTAESSSSSDDPAQAIAAHGVQAEVAEPP